MTLIEAFESYLETESVQKSKKTYAGDERMFRISAHYFRRVRDIHILGGIRTEDLERFHIWLAPEQDCGLFIKEPWMDTTVAHCCQKLKAVFNKAERLEHIPRNPAKWWKVPRGESRERRPLTPEEFSLLAKNVPSWFLPCLNTLRLTGARGASLASLRWEHIDFLNNRITFFSRKGGRKKLKQIIQPLSEPLKQLLLSIRPIGASGPVFLDDRGEPLTAQNIASIGSRGKKKAGLPENVVLYSLRHGFGTALVEAGASPDAIRRLMGHSNLNQQLTYQKFASLKPLEDALALIPK